MRTFLGLVAALAFVAPAFAGDKKDIVDTAVGAGSFKTLVAALKAADLVDTLKGEGPFTVLAPPMRPSPSCPRGPSRPCSSPRTRRSWSPS